MDAAISVLPVLTERDAPPEDRIKDVNDRLRTARDRRPAVQLQGELQ